MTMIELPDDIDAALAATVAHYNSRTGSSLTPADYLRKIIGDNMKTEEHTKVMQAVNAARAKEMAVSGDKVKALKAMTVAHDEAMAAAAAKKIQIAAMAGKIKVE